MEEKKVLIVDDEAHIRLLLEQTLDPLEDHDVELLIATNGQEALAQIRAERPEVVILDVMMPLMNGYDVCKAVKGDPELESTFIIMLTAKGQELDRLTAQEVGADLFMTKPFNPRKLSSTVMEILGL